jgi:uncharacterized membrane protein YfcA
VTDLFPLVLLAFVGLVAGALNVVAGGGSFLTLPVLIFLGLPATVANGTNRVGVLLQNLGGVWGFHRHKVLDWRWGWQVSVPAVAGAAVGTWLALQVGDLAFRRILAAVMVLMTIWPLVASSPAPGRTAAPARSAVVMAGFFLVGIYGGFLQAGVGFLILGLTSMSGFDLVRGNAIKVLSVLLLTVLSLAIFAAEQSVDWRLGLALGAGNFVGGQLGVRFTVFKGHRWVQTVVIAAIVVFAVRLWFF